MTQQSRRACYEQLTTVMASPTFSKFTSITVAAIFNGVPTVIATKSVRARACELVRCDTMAFAIAAQGEGVGLPLSGPKLALYEDLSGQPAPDDSTFLTQSTVSRGCCAGPGCRGGADGVCVHAQVEDDNQLTTAVHLGDRYPPNLKFVIFSTQIIDAFVVPEYTRVRVRARGRPRVLQAQYNRLVTLVVSMILTAVLCMAVWAVTASGVASLLDLIHTAAEENSWPKRPPKAPHCLVGEFRVLHSVSQRHPTHARGSAGVSRSRTLPCLQEFTAMWERVNLATGQLRAALAAKDQFLRYIFHEMRVPLNAVSLAVDELHEHAPAMDPKACTLLELASSQVGLTQEAPHLLTSLHRARQTARPAPR